MYVMTNTIYAAGRMYLDYFYRGMWGDMRNLVSGFFNQGIWTQVLGVVANLAGSYFGN